MRVARAPPCSQITAGCRTCNGQGLMLCVCSAQAPSIDRVAATNLPAALPLVLRASEGGTLNQPAASAPSRTLPAYRHNKLCKRS